jgi:hypothetical protein
MDPETLQMLQVLPADLLERGWKVSVSASGVSKGETPHYRAVYVRPVDDRLDIEKASAATYDKLTRQQIVRVSSFGDHSPNWHDARRDAIQRMRTADARYRRNAG